jgi:hypothetical protein
MRQHQRTALSLITSLNGNTVRNFPTHGQLSAAQGNLTSCLNFDFAILNLFEPRLCSLMVRKWSTVPISLSYTIPLSTPRVCSLMVRRWSTVPIFLSYTTPPLNPRSHVIVRDA